jgi:hypothetical protein
MNQIINLAASRPPPPTGTQRGTVLYLWWALQFLVVAAAAYGITRHFRRRAKNRPRSKNEG